MKKIAGYLFVLILTACSGEPIHRLETKSIPQFQSLTPQKVEEAIDSAAVFLGWKTKAVKPGLRLATYVKGSHTVQVSIAYTTDSYHIKYLDSRNMEYDGEEGEIHESYNIWVKELDNRIEKELQMLSAL